MTSPPTYANWGAVHRALDAAPSINGKEGVISASHALLVLIVIARHLNQDSGQTWLSHSSIAEECRLGLTTVKLAIAALADSKHLQVTPGNGGDVVRRANTYAFGPAMKSEQTTAAPAPSAPAPARRPHKQQSPPAPKSNRPPMQFTNFLDEFQGETA